MQSDLTTQSADITPAWIGNRHRHTDALLQKYTLAVIVTFSFLSLRGNKRYQMHIFRVYPFHEPFDFSKGFQTTAQMNSAVWEAVDLPFSSSHNKPQKKAKILNLDAVR